MNTLETDLLVIGGGVAGVNAAIWAREMEPELRVTIAEKANIARSGCLAMGLNAINLFLTDGSVDAYVGYVRGDAHGIIREDLVRSIGENCNRMADRLLAMGADIPTEDGKFVARSKRSIRLRGENVKQVMAARAHEAGVEVFNHLPIHALAQSASDRRVVGASGFNVFTGERFRIAARGVVLATGGAAGMYRPSNLGLSRKKSWYCPYNTGAGLAMGIRAGAEMTSFENRFIPLRTKDVVAPTGTLAFNKPIRQLNSRGEEYLKQTAEMLGRRLTTSERLYYTVQEHRRGNGPCMMDLSALSAAEYDALARDYLNMSPTLSLLMAAGEGRQDRIEVIGSEPYVNGGHGLAGFWVDLDRRTTLPGLYAAGDIAGGAPKKYLTGCMAEAETAVRTALGELPPAPARAPDIVWNDETLLSSLEVGAGPSARELEERLQKIMDEYAGGVGQHYEYSAPKLRVARGLLAELAAATEQGRAADPWQAAAVHDVRDLVCVSRVLIEHMLARRETRWPAYQSRQDFPLRNDIEYACFVNSVTGSEGVRTFRRNLDPPFTKMDMPDA